MQPNRPLRSVIVASAVLILTFATGFVTGGIQHTYEPEDCNRAIEKQDDSNRDI